MRFKNLLVIAIAAPVLMGCAQKWDVEAARDMESKGSAFQTGLQKEYVDLASSERAEDDWRDASFFVGKARQSAMGQEVGPQEISARRLPGNKIDEMSGARNRLTMALARGGASKMPAAAARAQAMFDCWMQEQEENFQPEDIARCRAAFDSAMAKLEAKPAAKPAPAPAPAPKPMKKRVMMPAPYMIYFDFDSSEIDMAADSILYWVAADFNKYRPSGVIVIGHADTSGSDEYNAMLANTRAIAAARSLASKGISATVLESRDYGESRPAIATGDGVAEAKNRRVEIMLKR